MLLKRLELMLARHEYPLSTTFLKGSVNDNLVDNE